MDAVVFMFNLSTRVPQQELKRFGFVKVAKTYTVIQPIGFKFV